MNISIYGAGHLTNSFMKGIAQIYNSQIKIYNRTKSKAENLIDSYDNLSVVECPEDLIDSEALVFLIIPPVEIVKLKSEFIKKMIDEKAILISCANGLSLQDLSKVYSNLKICRILPNVNWQILKGITLFKTNELIEINEKQKITNFLSAMTELSEVKDESDFDKVGKITSCGPGLFSAMFAAVQNEFNFISENEKILFQKTLTGTIEYQNLFKKSNEQVINEVANKTGLTKVGVDRIRNEVSPIIKLVSDAMDRKIEERNKHIKKEITLYNK